MFVESGVFGDELFLVFGHVVESVNRIGGAGRNAGAAVDTALGVDIHLRGGFKLWLIRLRMDAVSRANFDAKRIFGAVIGNYVGHDEFGLLKEVSAFGSVRIECKKAESTRP
jgi:hypothetical protein